MRQKRDHRTRLGSADQQLMMRCAQVLGDRACVRRLVETRVLETDRKSFHPPIGLALHEGHDQRGIHPTGQESPEPHIG